METQHHTAYTAYDGTQICESCLKLVIQKKNIGSANDIARLAAPKTAQVLYNALRVGPRLILRSAFELLRANMVTRVISVIVLLVIDKFSLITGRISIKQFIINITLALMLLVGGTAGWMLGSHALGLVVESLVLGIIAGIIGAGLLSAGLSFIVNKIIHLFVQDDTEDMLDIYNQCFASLAKEHKLNHEEIYAATNNICMSKEHIRDIFTEKSNRAAFACNKLEPCVKDVVERRAP
ncbi:MAG: hypothetical protein FWC92_04540 [Defluviitaleaceae bacterium]|nr:hypothetical protein [Defluviitaleaceae bacterium]